MSIGAISFTAPYVGVLLFARYLVGWPWPQAHVAGISMSTTSVAVSLHAVMVETGFQPDRTGQGRLAACFVTGSRHRAIALGLVFAHYDLWLALFIVVTILALWLLAKFAPTIAAGSRRAGERTADQVRGTRVVVPRWACQHRRQRGHAGLPRGHCARADVPARSGNSPNRMRIVAFTILTPFYFLKAGSLVEAHFRGCKRGRA